jgi:hypothetical protein
MASQVLTNDGSLVVLGQTALLGQTQVGALAIQANAKLTQVSTSTAAANSAILPSTTLGSQLGFDYTVRNDGVNSLFVFPQVGGAINTTVALGANLPMLVPPGGSCSFVPISSTLWVTRWHSGDVRGPVIAYPAAGGAQTAAGIGMVSNCVLQVPIIAGVSTLTLAAPTLGFKFKVQVTGIPSAILTIACGAATVNICEYFAADNTTNASAGNTNVLVAAAAAVGDSVEFECKSTNMWFVTPTCKVHTDVITS